VDRALAGDALDRAVGGLDDDAAAGDDAAVVAADGVEIDEAVLVDVGDDEAELVHVAGEHQHGIAGRIERREAVAEGVVGVGVGVRLDETVVVVDLDGAFAGEPRNLDLVAAIVALGLQVQLGGGMRTRATVERALALGVRRVVIGTRAAESEAFVGELVQAFGDKIAVGIDAKGGQVAVKGWVDTTGTTALALARRMDALGVATLIHTDVGTDGMLTGPNLARRKQWVRPCDAASSPAAA
jgi:hypothetical protein